MDLILKAAAKLVCRYIRINEGTTNIPLMLLQLDSYTLIYLSFILRNNKGFAEHRTSDSEPLS